MTYRTYTEVELKEFARANVEFLTDTLERTFRDISKQLPKLLLTSSEKEINNIYETVFDVLGNAVQTKLQDADYTSIRVITEIVGNAYMNAAKEVYQQQFMQKIEELAKTFQQKN